MRRTRQSPEKRREMKVCVVGASGKLGQYMVRHALDRGYEVVGVCREKSVGKLDRVKRLLIVDRGKDMLLRSAISCGDRGDDRRHRAE